MKSIGGVKAENGISSKPSEEVKAEPEKIDFSNVKIEPLFEEEVDFDTFSNWWKSLAWVRVHITDMSKE